MTTTLDKTNPAPPEAPAIAPGEPIDVPGWEGIVSRPDCNCAAAAWTRSWLFWAIGVSAFVAFVTQFFSAEHSVVWLSPVLVLLMTWTFGQDNRVVFRGGWWRKPRAYAWVLSVLMMMSLLVLALVAAVQNHGARDQRQLHGNDGTVYIPAKDLPENAYVDRDRVIFVDRDQEAR